MDQLPAERPASPGPVTGPAVADPPAATDAGDGRLGSLIAIRDEHLEKWGQFAPLALALLSAAGGLVLGSPVHIAGVPVFAAMMLRNGAPVAVLTAGDLSIRGRSGLADTARMWRTIGKASTLSYLATPSLVTLVLTTNLPKSGTPNSHALRCSCGVGRPIWGYVNVLTDEGLQKLLDAVTSTSR